MSGWAVVAWVLLGLVGLVTLLLASWLRLDARLDETAGRVRLRWIGLSVSLLSDGRALEVRWWRWRLARRTLGGRAEPARSRRRRREPDGPRGLRWPMGSGAWSFYRRQWVFLTRRVRVDRCEGQLRIATPDPAVTGLLYGAACSVTLPLAARWPGSALRVEPDFVGTFPGGWLTLALRVRLATLAWVAWRSVVHERSRAGRARIRAAGKGRDRHGTA